MITNALQHIQTMMKDIDSKLVSLECRIIPLEQQCKALVPVNRVPDIRDGDYWNVC